MDALSQLIEPLLSQRANPFSDALARDGIRRSARSLRQAYEEGMEDAAVREDLALASLFGGMCLANSGLGAVHGIAAAAGARLSAPHGAVCAAVLGAAMEINLSALRERAPEHPALLRMVEVATLLTGQPEASPEDAIAWLQELTAALAIPGLASYRLSEEEIPAMVTAAQKASSMRGNPIELTDAEVTEILTRFVREETSRRPPGFPLLGELATDLGRGFDKGHQGWRRPALGMPCDPEPSGRGLGSDGKDGDVGIVFVEGEQRQHRVGQAASRSGLEWSACRRSGRHISAAPGPAGTHCR